MPAEQNPIRILASTPAANIIGRELNRRRFLSFAAAAGGAAFLAACSSPSPSGGPQASGGPLEDKLTMYSWGDYDDPGEITGMYYWANGIDWNTTDTADIDACEDYLVNTIAKHISAFDSYPGSGALPQGTHALLQIWNGDARLGISESDDPDKWVWRLGAPDTEIWMDNWAIAAGAPHPEAAHAFINFVLKPENSLRELDYIGYHTGGSDIQQIAEDEGLEMLDLVFFTPEQLATMHTAEVNEAQQRIVDIWNKMKAAAGA
jgi:spermidine/putrescine transport system substrate-binding protein